MAEQCMMQDSTPTRSAKHFVEVYFGEQWEKLEVFTERDELAEFVDAAFGLPASLDALRGIVADIERANGAPSNNMEIAYKILDVLGNLEGTAG
jgi:hypothetical protein